jgi:hypothetical protein
MIMSRPTPETDTLEFALSALNFYDRYYKTLTLARSLERERDEARELARDLLDAFTKASAFCTYSDEWWNDARKALTKAKEVLG